MTDAQAPCVHFWRIQSGSPSDVIRMRCQRACGREVSLSLGEYTLLVSKGELELYLEKLFGKAEPGC